MRQWGIVSTFCLAMACHTAFAQSHSFPSRPVTLVTGTAASGSPYIEARLYSQKLTENLGYPVLVGPRACAGGRLGSAFVAKAGNDVRFDRRERRTSLA